MKKGFVGAIVAGILLAGAHAHADGADGAKRAPLSVSIEAGSDVAAEDVRRAIADELGSAVTAEQGRGASLAVRSANGVIGLTYTDDKGRIVRREITAPSDGAARVRTIALLAGNLARNEADELAPPTAPTAPGSADTRTEVTLRVAPSDTVTARVEVTPRSAAGAPITAPPRAPVVVEHVDDDPGSGMRTAGWITLGGGALLTGGGALLLMQAKSDRDALLQTCAPNCGQSAVDAASNKHNLGVGLLVVGGAAVVTGTVLVLAAPRRHVALSAGLGEVRLSGTW